MRGFLNDCCKIELMASRIYQHFSMQPHYPERLRQTFRQLARDEEEHARQFDLALQLPEGSLSEVKRIAGEKVLGGLDMARALYAKLQQEDFDEETALKTALKLEEEFVRIHLDNSVLIQDERIAGLFSGLARGDDEHLETLRDTIIWWKKRRADQGSLRPAQ